jgi:hypothetical protein
MYYIEFKNLVNHDLKQKSEALDKYIHTDSENIIMKQLNDELKLKLLKQKKVNA